MGEDSKIQWTHHTFNPWIGCAHVSPGCENCYAEVETFPRVQRSRGIELWGVKAERHVTSDANWRKPLMWNEAARADGVRHRVFCASLSDVFENRPELAEPRARLWRLILSTPHLDWLLLTKRPENLRKMLPWMCDACAARGGHDPEGCPECFNGSGAPWPNVWLGTTVEDRRRADERIPHLLRVPAAVRFLSCEPLLEAVDLSHWLTIPDGLDDDPHARHLMTEAIREGRGDCERMIGWVIVGGESGPGARIFDLAWARSIVSQCRAAKVPVFVKQMGSDPIDGAAGCEVWQRDKKGGDPAEWPPELRVRQFPAVRP